jgi:hypothetical protein
MATGGLPQSQHRNWLDLTDQIGQCSLTLSKSAGQLGALHPEMAQLNPIEAPGNLPR